MTTAMRFMTVTAALLALSFAPAASHAASITYNLNFEFSGAQQPAGDPPWVTATFDDGGTAGEVSLTISAVGLTGSEFISQLYFNSSVLPLDIVQDSGPTAVISQGADAFQADGDGKFDVLLDFPQPANDRFVGGLEAGFTITGAGITASTFDELSAPGGGAGSFHVAAHVQGIGEDGQGSGWIGDTNGNGVPGEQVPLPGTLVLLGMGVTAIAAGLASRKLARRN